MTTHRRSRVLVALEGKLPDLEALYVDLHLHPELAFAETRTAAELPRRLGVSGYEVHTGIGHTGVLGVLRNGRGPTVMLRADMDALPVEEKTGLDYASKVRAPDAEGSEVPMMHACGQDTHVTWLSVAADLLFAGRATWSGTLLVVFQPGEEAGDGAAGMVRDGVFGPLASPMSYLASTSSPVRQARCSPGQV